MQAATGFVTSSRFVPTQKVVTNAQTAQAGTTGRTMGQNSLSNVLHVSQLTDASLKLAQTVATPCAPFVQLAPLERPRKIVVALRARAVQMEATVRVATVLAGTLPSRRDSPVPPVSLK